MFLGLAWNHWAAIIGGLALLAYVGSDYLPSLATVMGWFGGGGDTTVPLATSRVKAVEYIDYLLVFFKDCPEGLKGIQTAGQHLFHDHPGA